MCDSVALNMLFVSDLDKTLVYSGYPDQVCIERIEDKEITYMTPKAVDLFNALVSRDDFHFIPCTMRSYEQTIRISLLQSLPKSIFICDNGFSIYENGCLDKKWDEYVQRQLMDYPNENLYLKLQSYGARNLQEVTRVKSNRDAFITIIFTNDKVAQKHLAAVDDLVDGLLYRLELQGRKLYVIPRFLDKSLAVRYLLTMFQKELVITAGDSVLDEAFVKEGGIRIVPNHASIHVQHSIRTANSNIMAGEEILQMVYDKIY